METFDTLYSKLKASGVFGYQQKYPEECEMIWKTQVPYAGQSSSVQGELMREIEKLRLEAQRNGNANWDEYFAWFCGNMYELFAASGVFDETRLAAVRTALDYLKICGETGRVHTEDDVYDYVCDLIAEYAAAKPEPVPYQKRENLPR